ncbi:hypothetical protein FRC12_004404 [Ceratobasidium sp. 428]|nr:hypothetical protein FRC12_004404 [Ceratobasidium sp. 428]
MTHTNKVTACYDPTLYSHRHLRPATANRPPAASGRLPAAGYRCQVIFLTTQLGPIQNILQYKKVVSFFEDAHANGYKFVLGGDINPNPTDGLFVPISVIDNPPDDSKIVREEPFGPIVPLLKWSDEKDVIKRANNTNLGLAASVWGEDLETVERIAKQIQAGSEYLFSQTSAWNLIATFVAAVCMNEFIPFGPLNSYGGHKESGLGVEGGLPGLTAYTNLQSLTLRKKPAVKA